MHIKYFIDTYIFIIDALQYVPKHNLHFTFIQTHIMWVYNIDDLINKLINILYK